MNFIFYKLEKKKQYFFSLSLIVLVASFCYIFSGLIDYKVTALILLVSVSLVAMFFDIWPVLMAALLSALVWNFFFIPPKFTFAIQDTENILMFLMYFIVASVNAVLTFKIRQIEKIASKKEEKENTLKLYDTLLNSLSHELRTPISTIIGASDNLLEPENKLSEENKKELVSEISKASLRLNREVENLLNMSRLDSGFIKPKKDWCDTAELVHEVMNRINEQFKNRPVHVQLKDNLPLFKLDYGLLEEVLFNLVHNAALYIPKYAVITVKARCMDEKLILIVEDTGNGFPEDEIEFVFDKFYRLKNSNTGGTGLGLSIVKGFVEAMGGQITLKNLPEGGAQFTIEIKTETSYVNQIKNE